MELLDFYSKSCSPCKMIAPKIEDFVKEKNLQLIKIDAYEDKNLAEKYGIKSVPTLILLKEGEEVFRESGIKSITKLENIWELI